MWPLHSLGSSILLPPGLVCGSSFYSPILPVSSTLHQTYCSASLPVSSALAPLIQQSPCPFLSPPPPIVCWEKREAEYMWRAGYKSNSFPSSFSFSVLRLCPGTLAQLKATLERVLDSDLPQQNLTRNYNLFWLYMPVIAFPHAFHKRQPWWTALSNKSVHHLPVFG